MTDQAAFQSPLQLGVGYEDRFMDEHVGKLLLNDCVAATIELLANSWDAGATRVQVTWPDFGAGEFVFAVSDNGIGMTPVEFERIWPKLSYNRLSERGNRARFPDSIGPMPARTAYGRNGIGRWAAFCFGESYEVVTSSETLISGKQVQSAYTVQRTTPGPFRITPLETKESVAAHGTTVRVNHVQRIGLPPLSFIRSEIGMRFLIDPNFEVHVNGSAVDFSDISDDHMETYDITLEDGNVVTLIVIHMQDSDRTARHHGIAWHVNNRLVGEVSWTGLGDEFADHIDRRRALAKRLTFIVKADYLADAVRNDWSGFDSNNIAFKTAAKQIHRIVRGRLFEVSREERDRTLRRAREISAKTLAAVGPLARDKWANFMEKIFEYCPSIKDQDILKLSEIMLNLELSSSGFKLLQQLSDLDFSQLDELSSILDEWTVEYAKITLDEISRRLRLIDELEIRTDSNHTREVQDLQPLIEQGLWMFGAEYESIEFTSNRSMATVVRKFFDAPYPGPGFRPDFVIAPDSTIGVYTRPAYDEQNDELGIERLVVIELKRPGVTIGLDAYTQCWKYISEILASGRVSRPGGKLKVTGYVVGSSVDARERSPLGREGDDVTITAMSFADLIGRARGRMLTLERRVKDAPALIAHRAEIEEFVKQQAVTAGAQQLLPEPT